MCDFTEMTPFIAELRAKQGSPAMHAPIQFFRPADRRWPERLAAPVDPLETTLCARAQSLLTGGELGVCPPLKPDQARDVLAWAGFAI